MTPDQRNAMQSYVDRGYELFVKRCAEGRGVSVDSIKAIAEGRVWDGLTASRIGLVDRLGGLDMALADMAAELDAADNYKIKEYPDLKFKWWEEVLNMSSNMKASVVETELGQYAPLYRIARMRPPLGSAMPDGIYNNPLTQPALIPLKPKDYLLIMARRKGLIPFLILYPLSLLYGLGVAVPQHDV